MLERTVFLVIISSDGLYNDFVAGVVTILTVYNYFATPKQRLPAMGQEEKNFSKVY
jgi:hypothetical protein